jgi:hypothetical protein
LGAWLVGVAGPLLHLWRWSVPSGPSIVAVVVTTALWAGLAAVRPFGRDRVNDAVLIVSGGVLLAVAQLWAGWTEAVFAFSGVAVASFALVSRTHRGDGPRPTARRAWLAVGPLVAAGIAWARTSSRPATSALLLLAAALVAVEHRYPAAVTRIERAALNRLRRVASAAGHLLVGLVVLPLVLVPAWLMAVWGRAERALRRRIGRSNWRVRRLTLADEWTDARRPFSASPPRRRRAGNLMAAVVLFGLVAVVADSQIDTSAPPPVVVQATTTTAAIKLTDPDPAFAARPWEAMLRLPSGGFYRYDSAGGFRVTDLTSPYVNVADGERRSSPPKPQKGTDPLDVWMFGGSAAFGTGQRDGHTISSEVVRLAGKDGVEVRMHNFGVPASLNWQSAMRLVYLLEWREPPDLIVFYDGFNDAGAQQQLNAQGRGTSDTPVSYFDEDFNAVLSPDEVVVPPELAPVEVSPSTTVPFVTDPQVLADAIVRRYGRGLDAARAAAKAADVPVVALWQPSLVTKANRTDEEDRLLVAAGVDKSTEQGASDLVNAVRSRLPGIGVVDLSDAADGAEGTAYLDIVHNNEDGARVWLGRCTANCVRPSGDCPGPSPVIGAPLTGADASGLGAR